MTDHDEHVHYGGSGKWEPADLFGLPHGVEYQLLKNDEAEGLVVGFSRYPVGYHEPRHVHEAEHFAVIMEGEMHVGGHVLKRGDVFHGPAGEAHGPFDYPQGCTIWGFSHGGAILHKYDSEDAGRSSGRGT